MSLPISRTSRGFTLIELLVVIAVIAILIGLRAPGRSESACGSGSGHRVSTTRKQLALGVHNYHDATGSVPPLADVVAAGKNYASVYYFLLPYIEQPAVFSMRLTNGGVWENSPNNAGSTKIKTFLSLRPFRPLDIWKESNGGTWAISNYGVNHAIFAHPLWQQHGLASDPDRDHRWALPTRSVSPSSMAAAAKANPTPRLAAVSFHQLWRIRTVAVERVALPIPGSRVPGMAGTDMGNNSACTVIETSTAAAPQGQPTVDACNPYFVQAMDTAGCVVGLMDE